MTIKGKRKEKAMSLQQQILCNYFEVYGKEKTLKEISGHLGIQITRVFRILNGYEMKISEYEKFRQATSKKNDSHDLMDVAMKAEKIFSVRLNNEVKQIMEMKIRLQHTLSDKE
jgi:hypothetical protein